MSKYLTRSVLKRIDAIQSETLLIKEIAEVTGSEESAVRKHFHDIKTRNYAAISYLLSVFLFWGSLIWKKGAVILQTVDGRSALLVLTLISLMFPFYVVIWRNIWRP